MVLIKVVGIIIGLEPGTFRTNGLGENRIGVILVD